MIIFRHGPHEWLTCMTDTFSDHLLRTLPVLRGYAMSLTRCAATADDLLQEAALRAWQYRDQFQPGTNFRAWFCRIIRNEYISGLRRRRPSVDIAEVPEQFLATVGNQEDRIAVGEMLRVFAKLPIRHREVLTLICGHNFTYEEAAQAMGCTVGTIKSKLWRARTEMQRRLMGEYRPRRVVAQKGGKMRGAAYAGV